MPLTDREAFKIGFLQRCVEDGLNPSQMHQRIKEAQDKLAGIASTLAGKVVDAGKGVAAGALGYGLPLALAAPPILGAMGGYGLAKMTDIDDTDVAEIKDQEVLNEYQRQTARLRRERAVRDYQKAKKQTGRIFL